MDSSQSDPLQPIQPERKTRSWLKTVGIVIGVIIVISLALVITARLWLPKAIAIFVLYETRNENLAWKPTPEKLPPVNITNQKRYSFDTISFETPWTGSSTVRTNDTNGFVISFQGGTDTPTTTVGIMPGPAFHQELFRDQDSKDAAVMQSFLGPQLNTNYALYNYTINLTPQDLNLFDSNASLLPKAELLILKGTFIPYWSGPVYSFTTQNGIRGFQFTASATSTVYMIFTPHDVPYSMFITQANPDANAYIVQSIREATTSTPAAAP